MGDSLPASPFMTAQKRPSLKTLPSLALIRSSSQPTLADLKLSHILNNETCPPISFNEFATFTTRKEFTSENLLFVLWFRSYRQRYHRVPKDQRIRVPVPSTILGDRYRPFEYLDEQRDTLISPISPKTASSLGSPVTPTLFENTPALGFSQPVSQHTFAVCDRAAGQQGTFFPANFFRRTSSTKSKLEDDFTQASTRPTRPPAGTIFLDVPEQPMREEAVRAFSTFLKKGGSKELGISDELRQFAKTCLQRSSAPEVFLPIYEEVYQTLETQSLPHFLQYAEGNVNKPKAIFWYIVGTIDFLIGVTIFLLITLLVSKNRFAYRAIRLPSTIFTWFGVAQIYSAYRGFCSQVWGRQAAQLRPWEMDEGDEEHLINTPEPTLSSPPMQDTAASSSDTATHHRDNSFASEVLFTPKAKDSDLILPDEVFPLSDLTNAMKTSPADSTDDLPWGRPVQHDDDAMDQVARRQLAIRRATIKVPDASLAFPIDDGFAPRSVTPEQALSGIQDSPTRFTHASPSAPAPRRSVEEGNTVDREESPIDTSNLDLAGLIRAMRGKTSGKSIGKATMFGPEHLVKDPRVRRLYDSIVRDITIVATILGVVWVGLCFAVPMAGLA